MIDEIKNRSQGVCEICSSSDELQIYSIKDEMDFSANICGICTKAANFEIENPAYFECLQTAMWSEIPAVKIISYQILNALKSEAFAKELLEILYIEDELKEFAKEPNLASAPTLDSNGIQLVAGDSVTIIKDLDVKGTGFVAKRGTLVKNIILTNNKEQIEGRVNGVRIVLLSKFLKKV